MEKLIEVVEYEVIRI